MIRSLLCVLGLCAGVAHAGAPPVELPQLLSQRAEVAIEKGGLQSLELPVEVIRACRPGFSDLRLWDEGQEVPYLIDSTGADWTLAEKVDAKVTRVARDRAAALCKGSDPKTSHCESLDLAPPPAGEGWELVFQIERPSFADRVELSGEVLGKEGKPTPFSQSESLFRLTGPGERLRLPLPAKLTRLTVTLLGEGAPLAPKLRYERGTTVRGAELLDDSLTVSARFHDRAGTHLLIDRPLGLLPIAIRFATQSAAFDRKVQVYDVPSPSTRRLIGEGRITRVHVGAGSTQIAIEQLDVPIAVARSRHLELVIDDGDSPALDKLMARAVLHRPVLVFHRDTPGTVALLFGGGRAEAPRYDLQALLPEAEVSDDNGGVRARLAARLVRREGLATARLGPIGPNPRFDPTPALASVAHAGAPIDLALYSHQRPLTIVPSPDGLSHYLLRPEDLAVARPDLGDLRVVDDKGRQWPYVVEREVDPALVEVSPPRPTSQNGVSLYPLTLPASPLPLVEITVDAAERFFNRALKLRVKDVAGRERVVEGFTLTRAPGQSEPITLSLSEVGASSLTLEVTDGGDAPLTLTAVRLHVPTAALELAATAGNYRLVAGNPEETPPTYELRALGSLLGQLEPAEVKAGALGDNPAFSRSARLRAGGARERLLVWIALGLAVVVLGALTLRMARSEQGGSGGAA